MVEETPYLVRLERALAYYTMEISDYEKELDRLLKKLEASSINNYPQHLQKIIWISIRTTMGRLKYYRRRHKERLEQIKDGSFII